MVLSYLLLAHLVLLIPYCNIFEQKSKNRYLIYLLSLHCKFYNYEKKTAKDVVDKKDLAADISVDIFIYNYCSYITIYTSGKAKNQLLYHNLQLYQLFSTIYLSPSQLLLLYHDFYKQTSFLQVRRQKLLCDKCNDYI